MCVHGIYVHDYIIGWISCDLVWARIQQEGPEVARRGAPAAAVRPRATRRGAWEWGGTALGRRRRRAGVEGGRGDGTRRGIDWGGDAHKYETKPQQTKKH